MALLDRKYIPWRYEDRLSQLPAELKDNIIRCLPVKTLGRLARVSKLFYEIVTPILYKKDAVDERPRAIFWAASLDANPDNEKTITKVLDLAKEYGGDVNRMDHYGEDSAHKAAPLHVAAARGNVAAARKLLELGAYVNALGRGLLNPRQARSQDRPFSSELGEPTIRVAATRGKWRPLFVPFVLQDEEMIQLLLRFDASPVLSIPIDNSRTTGYDPCTINILHILAAKPGTKTTDDADRSYFETFSGLIDVPLFQDSTPLFLALRHRNWKALGELMANGANVESLNQCGRSLLTQAITYRFTSQDPGARQRYDEFVAHLIRSGAAKISNYGSQEVWETPLTCSIKAIPAIPAEYKRATQDVGAMIDLLLEHGADVNEISNEGITMLHALCDVICRGNNGGGLVEIFGQRVESGADVTIPFPSGRSVLGTCILKHNQRPPKFFKLLLELHAPLVPQEVDAVFVKWAQSSSLRKTLNGYLPQYRQHVSQTAIDSVYGTVLGNDEALFNLLKEHLPRTTIAERFASETLLGRETHFKWFHLVLGMKGFDGSYIHKDGNGLLHCIIHRLENNPNYKDLQARDDASEVLWRGALPSHRNARGKTPLQALRDFVPKRACPILRLYLYDVEARLDELVAGHAPESINQPKMKKQWRKILGDLLPDE
ncbi:ankyrin repeat-containing domain protein [Trichoderma novae-zelandiae]